VTLRFQWKLKSKMPDKEPNPEQQPTEQSAELNKAPHALGRVREFMNSPTFQTTKVWSVMTLISIALIIAGHRSGDRFGLLVGFFLALALNAVVLFYADLRLASLFPSTELEGRDPWGLIALTGTLASSLGVRRPAIHLVSAATPIAFSTGLLTTHSTLYISEELLKRLTPDEIRAVLAYELIRIKERQTGISTAGAALAGIFALVADGLDRFVLLGFFFNRRGHRTGLVMVLISPLLVILTRLASTRKSVLRADRLAAELIAAPSTMARTLWKLDAYAHARPLNLSLAEGHLFIVNPIRAFNQISWFQAQPSVKHRITHLLGHYPL
jgi:heat shock protein HtpX